MLPAEQYCRRDADADEIFIFKSFYIFLNERYFAGRFLFSGVFFTVLITVNLIFIVSIDFISYDLI